MKRILLISTLVVVAVLNAFAQQLEIPKNYVFETREDFARYEKNVIECVDWLVKTPISAENNETRFEANMFVLEWIFGSPTVVVNLNKNMRTFLADNNSDYLTIFLGGWTRYALQSNRPNNIDGNIAGIQAVIDYYTINKETLPKKESVENFISMQKKGKLRDYVVEITQKKD